jgi:hypothetical protein
MAVAGLICLKHPNNLIQMAEKRERRGNSRSTIDNEMGKVAIVLTAVLAGK